MEEVVVIGMGTQRKVSVTGAVAVVDTKDLELPATNIVNTLGGRVPGVISIQSSGEPGRNISEFWVRGIGTFGANSGALVLIDGLEDEPGIGSITNSEGRFKLTAKLYNTLAVSFMGYETAEQIITSAADVKITLREGNRPADAAKFNKPVGLAITAEGNLYIGDSENYAIRRIAIE